MSKLLSSNQIIKPLLKYGFQLVSQRGSHQKYQKKRFYRNCTFTKKKKSQQVHSVQQCVSQGLTIDDFFDRPKKY